jgi:hypothetical protein
MYYTEIFPRVKAFLKFFRLDRKRAALYNYILNIYVLYAVCRQKIRGDVKNEGIDKRQIRAANAA